MSLAIITFPTDNYYHKAAEMAIEQSLIYYASEAADKMEFQSFEELRDAIKRAMQLCEALGLSVDKNFRRIFKSSPLGLVCDWRLSVLAYNLVQLNGNPSNAYVAKFQVDLLKRNYQ